MELSCYNLSGGQLTVNGSENIGSGGPGTFTQSGGVHTVGTPFFARGLGIAHNGSSFVLLGGSLNVIGYEYIDGTFTQSGGSNAASATETIAGFPGAYIHSGGTHTVGTALVNANIAVGYGYPGSYALSGTGNLTVNGTAFIGGNSTALFGQMGTLDISGGIANIDTLKIWDTGDAAPGGTRVNLSGGTLPIQHASTGRAGRWISRMEWWWMSAGRWERLSICQPE